MRVTLRLSLAIGLWILLVLSVHGWVRVQSDAQEARDDVRRDHVLVGRVLATGVARMMARGDLEAAHQLVEAVNEREPYVQIRWIQPGEAPLVAHTQLVDDHSPKTFVTEIDGVTAIATYTPIAHDPSTPATSIEMVERLTWEADHQRSTIARMAVTTLVLLAACLLSLAVFGALFVGRPIAALRDHVRRVGAGDLDAKLASTGRDELAELAGDMQAMTASLRAARARAEEAAAARAETLEKLRHTDRLRAVGEMAAAVAHEVGTPLAVVRARGQQIASGSVSEERMRELGHIVVGETDRMSAIIRRLLDLSRADVHQIENVVVAEWAREAIGLLEPLARAADVTLELDADAAIDPIAIDPGRMRQVLTNIVMNAVQASPRGERVRVRAVVDRAVTPPELRLAVEDRGPGIPEAERARVFEPFVTSKASGEGTGLGLWVAAGIVRESRGTITISDAEGGGARFEVRVPSAAQAPTARGSTRRRIERT